jgi:hypothetical protein
MAKTAEENGIPDWGKKLSLIKALMDVKTDAQFVARVVEGAPRWTASDTGSIEGRLKKWKTSLPTQDPAPHFFELLADKLPTKDRINGQLLTQLGIADYIRHLPKDDDAVIAVLRHHGFFSNNESSTLISPGVGSDDAPADDDEGFYRLWNHDSGPTETIQMGFRKGKIDQRHYYVDPDSANAWSALVRADAYPTYGDCKTGLELLVHSSQWTAALNTGKPRTIVMLAGGGAPTKDLLFLKDLLGRSYVGERVHLYLLDISYFMLTNSKRAIQEHARLLGFAERVEITLLCGNVLEMTKDEGKLFHQHGSVIFAITGGTIGNFSEERFFRSLHRVAQPGDLIVVSADTVDEFSQQDEAALISKYDNHALRQFLRPVVGAVLNAANAKESIDQALARLETKLLSPDNEENTSNVPGSFCVVVTLAVNGRSITLVTSTRYRSAALEAYAAKFHWKHLLHISSPLNSHFKHFLFHLG